jgi:hypothetical protein
MESRPCQAGVSGKAGSLDDGGKNHTPGSRAAEFLRIGDESQRAAVRQKGKLSRAVGDPLWRRIYDLPVPLGVGGASRVSGGAPASLTKAHIWPQVGESEIGGDFRGVHEILIQGENVVFRRGERDDGAELDARRKGPKAGGGIRGKVSGFSKASRRRCTRAIQAIAWDFVVEWYLTAFVTLTFPKEYPSPAESKVILHKFRKRVQREFNVSAVWKMEPQRRGAPHYHLLMTFWDHLRGESLWDGEAECSIPFRVLRMWVEAVGSEDRKHRRYHLIEHWAECFQWIESPKSIIRYLSKYVGKQEESPDWVWPGRWWGMWGREGFARFVRGDRFLVDRVAWCKIRRILRKRAPRSVQRSGVAKNSDTWWTFGSSVVRRLMEWVERELSGAGPPGLPACVHLGEFDDWIG